MSRSILASCLTLGLAITGHATAQTQQNPSFNLLNRGNQIIFVINVSPTSNPRWGEDRLGDEVLEPGHFLPIRLRSGQCRNDIRVIYDNGTYEERRNQNTCAITDVTFDGSDATAPNNRRGSGATPPPRNRQEPAQQNQPALHIVNNSGQSIQAVHASPTSNRSWGQSLIRRRIRDGHAQRITLPRGSCMYDIRVTFADHTDDQRRNINLCTNQEQAYE